MAWRKKPSLAVGPGGFIFPLGDPWFEYDQATKLPTPGAMSYGFNHNYQAARPMIGPAMGVLRQYTAFGGAGQGGAQQLQTQKAVVLNGLGGVATGQIYGQPLSNPYV